MMIIMGIVGTIFAIVVIGKISVVISFIVPISICYHACLSIAFEILFNIEIKLSNFLLRI